MRLCQRKSQPSLAAVVSHHVPADEANVTGNSNISFLLDFIMLIVIYSSQHDITLIDWVTIIPVTMKNSTFPPLRWSKPTETTVGDCKDSTGKMWFTIILWWRRAASPWKLSKTFIISRCGTFAVSGLGDMPVTFSHTQFLLPFSSGPPSQVQVGLKNKEKKKQQLHTSV